MSGVAKYLGSTMLVMAICPFLLGWNKVMMAICPAGKLFWWQNVVMAICHGDLMSDGNKLCVVLWCS